MIAVEASVISRGKTVQHAVETALTLLGTTKDHVHIEILESETRGVLGLMAKKAVVRVTRKTEISKEESRSPMSVALEEYISEELSGTQADQADQSKQPNHTKATEAHSSRSKAYSGKAWIENGIIGTLDAPDQFPLISPMKEGKLYKNGNLVEQTTTIVERDVFRVELINEDQRPVWSIEIDDRNMKARLNVEPGFRITRTLKDQAPTSHLTLLAAEDKQPLAINMQDVLNELKARGVTVGILSENIAMACKSVVRGSFEIAIGQEPVPGKNGYLKPLFETNENQAIMPKTRPDGTIDYREIKEFPSVTEGRVIGLIMPPEPGKPGLDVMGRRVEPEPVHELQLKLGEGVTLLDDPTKVLSIQSGRPNLVQKGVHAELSIVPKLVHGADVDIASGNIRFQGDVDILGTVQDGMTVEAEGSVMVRGNVNIARIKTGHSLIIHANVIGSDVVAGKGSMFTAEAYPLLLDIHEKAKFLRNAVVQVNNASAFKATDYNEKGLGPLIKVLLQGKFKLLRETIVDLTKMVMDATAEIDPEWTEYAGYLRKAFLNPVSSTIKELKDLDGFIEKTEFWMSKAQPSQEQSLLCQFAYAQNSTIYCEGDINALQGCYNTTIYSSGLLVVKGFLRGGEYFAKNGVRAAEVGSVSGSITKIRVPAGAEIHLTKAMESTILQIGTRVQQLTQETSHIRAKLDADGVLHIH
ncbi:flagellar assembly protein A [Paenibacillus xanthanilyticus]|uniref:Flagellar assembly protein A n=1 Tax=Paenibacillus xanthanilyticus TaxID=1783531 RepID=A0ABV8JX79_9BACL